MKKNASSCARLVSLLGCLIVSPLYAQQTTAGGAKTLPATAVATTPTTTAVSRSIPETPLAAGLAQNVTMKLKWNDAGGGFSIPVQNTSDQPLRIDAIQSSGDLFIVSFPTTIAPRHSDNIIVLLDAKPGTSSDSDVIRLKTSQGEKAVTVAHDREKVASLDQSELTWSVGETVAAKSVVVQISANTTKLTKARAMAGATATVDDLGGGKFRVNVTPRSTTASTAFPVILEFDPVLPGATPVITCLIGTKG